MSTSADRPFTVPEVADYERRRYRGLDQRLVHGREMRILRSLLGAARPLRSAPVLDMPCGFGRFSGLLEETGGRVVSGDYSGAMVAQALRRRTSAAPPLGVVTDAKRGLPFADGVFGLVFSIRFFHHLREREHRRAVLGELARVSGEWAVISYYRLNPLHRGQRILRRAVKRSRTRISMISGSEFREDAARAGFRTVISRSLFPGLHAQTFVLLKKENTKRSA
ncbi:MAG: class I SAM-dependent methyltransferase [Candidatus Aminicenantes bacterium]|nr:class I SAM-dependent methyltransferase [Candidatus Aminicenantes bacterium]